jgi:hypothetical protein
MRGEEKKKLTRIDRIRGKAKGKSKKANVKPA